VLTIGSDLGLHVGYSRMKSVQTKVDSYRFASSCPQGALVDECARRQFKPSAMLDRRVEQFVIERAGDVSAEVKNCFRQRKQSKAAPHKIAFENTPLWDAEPVRELSR
jgi:hypothetical protein